MTKFTFYLLVLFSVSNLWSQGEDEKRIHGKIVADALVSGIEIVNLNNEKVAKTNDSGDFFILAKADDVLVFSAKDFEFKRYIIEEEDLKSEIVMIGMIPKIIEIEAVTINEHPEINAVSLGILMKPAKYVSPAHRGKYSQPKGIYDALKIMITGKNPARDRAILYQTNIAMLDKMEYLFDESYYIETLQIPVDYVKAFQYYCIENQNMTKALNSKDKSMMAFLMIDLAKQYNEMIVCED